MLQTEQSVTLFRAWFWSGLLYSGFIWRKENIMHFLNLGKNNTMTRPYSSCYIQNLKCHNKRQASLIKYPHDTYCWKYVANMLDKKTTTL